MIPCISIDGTDGSGKTTLLDALKKIYNVVTLPRFYSMGMVPFDVKERKNWFLSQDVLTTTKIYISGHKNRIYCAEDFKKGLHYKFVNQNENNLIVLDRGLWSLKAFSFAALRKGLPLTETQADELILELFDKEFIRHALRIIDLSIVLFDDSKDALTKILQRRQYNANDKFLVENQYKFYARHTKELPQTLIISPLKSAEEVAQFATAAIEGLKNV